MNVKAHKDVSARKRRSTTQILQGVQARICTGFDLLFPKTFRIDGRADFRSRIVPRFLTRHNQRVYELCNDHDPVISAQDKQRHKLKITTIHQNEHELSLMPQGCYDSSIVANITKFYGAGDGDLVIGDSILNHTDDAEEAMRRIVTLLKPGGLGLFYVTSRLGWYARMCSNVPEGFLRKMLFRVFPPKGREYDLSAARYDNCSPKELRQIALANGMEVLSVRPYFNGPYYRTVFPVYILWRTWTAFHRVFFKEQAGESFTLILQKHR